MEREKQDLMMRLYQVEEKTRKAEKGEEGSCARVRVIMLAGEPEANRLCMQATCFVNNMKDE